MSAITSAAPQPDSAPSATPATRAERLLTQFTEFRSELDEHQAQRERVIRCSREITAVSKKTIFSLQRMGTGASKAVVFKEAEQKLGQLRVQFELVQKEVQGADFWRYERSISPGLQEYLEAFTFYHYLEHHTLPTLEQAQASLIPPPPAADSTTASSSEDATAPPATTPASTTPYVRVTVDDYLGGVADLTGELMRLAIASVGRNLSDSLASGGGEKGEQGEGDFANIDYIGKLVREIKGEMDPLAIHCRWLPKKLQVLDQSLAKIESASYNLRIRGAEYKDSPKMLQALAKSMAEGGGGGRGGEVEASA